MANYDVDFSHSRTDTPKVFDVHVVMWSVLGVPDHLEGDARLNYIEAELKRRIPGVAHIEGLRIRGE